MGDNAMPQKPEHAAAEMVDIFGFDAENLALSLSHKFSVRGDAVGAKTWDDIAAAVGDLRRRRITRRATRANSVGA